MIAVFGGTGRLGRPLVERLVAAGHQVRVVSRDPELARSFAPSVEIVRADVREPASLPAALEGVDTVVSAVTGYGGRKAAGARAVDLEGNLNLIRTASEAGVDHLILLSASHASADHPIELFRMKYRAEQALRTSGLDWTILRPTTYAELWLDMLGRPLAKTGRTRVFGRGRNPINFVSVEDVAAFAALAVADPGLRGRVIELPGPDNLSFDELLEPVSRLCGGRIDHVSPRMLRTMAVAMRLFNPVLGAQIWSAVIMDERDMTVDPSVRAGYPVPLTHPADVARRMFAAEPNGSRAG